MNTIKTAMLLAAMTALFMAVGYAIGGGTGMLIAFAIAAAMNLMSYWNGDRMVLSMHRAKEVGPDNAPEFHEIVRRLAEAADLPMPRLYVIDSAQPNAFATGRDPRHAAVAATTGLLETLTPEEVAGVMAHELAHIAHRDTLTMTITATLAGAIGMLGNFAFFLGGHRDNNPFGLIGTLLAIIVAPFAAMIVQMAISRTREYSADRRAAEICGRPLWLAAALEKIARIAPRIPNRLAEENPATAHLFIFNPLGAHSRDSLFSTHPAPENRIAALVAMAAEFEEEEAARDAGPVRAPGPRGDRPATPHAPRRAGQASHKWGRPGSNAGNDGDADDKDGPSGGPSGGPSVGPWG